MNTTTWTKINQKDTLEDFLNKNFQFYKEIISIVPIEYSIYNVLISALIVWKDVK